MRRWPALAGLLLFVAVAPAGAATLLSETTWGGPVSEVVGGVAVAGDGSTYLTGFTTSFAPDGTAAVFLVKFGPDASLTWQRTWESGDAFGSDEAREVAVASDGSVYVVARTFGVGGDAVLLKFSPDGSLLWQRRWGGAASEDPQALAVAADGSVYVVGGSDSFGGSNLFVVKFAPDGSLLWQKVWGPDANGSGVAVGPDGNVYVAGVAPRPTGLFEFDVIVLKLTPDGAVVWQTAYSGSEIADARGGLAVGADGSIYVAGTIQASTRKVVVDALLVKLGPDGTLVWDRAWGGRSGDTGEGVAVAGDGTVHFVGNTNDQGAGSDDAFHLHVSPEGRAIDGNTWGGAGIDHGDDVALAPDGTVSLGATAESPPYVFQSMSTRLSRLRGTATTATGSLGDVSGSVDDPAGTVATPAGSTTYAGGFEAALVRIGP